MLDKWDKLYLDIAERIGQMSYADRKKVGAILVRDKNILAYGFNGTPSGMDNCCEHNDITKREVLHAESNAIAKIAKSPNNSDGATLYVTLSPCFECAKLIIQSGITRVVFLEKYRDESSINFLEQNGIEVEHYNA